jgi:amino acid adenylation domain-containing protein
MTQLSSNPGKALSLAQRQLLDRLLKGKQGEGAREGILRLPEGARIPLSSAQARIWFFSRMYPESPEYNIFGAPLSFAVCPDRASIEAALRTLMDRHDALRLRIVEVNEEPLQEECTGLDLPLTWHDLSGMSVADAEHQAKEIGSSIARTPFKLDQPPLFRVSVIHLPEGKALVILVCHHVVVDGWSMDIFYEELTALLSGKSLKPAPAIRFLDYVAWERGNVSEQRLAREMSYWSVKLAGELPVLDVPKDRPRQATISRTGHTVSCSISSAIIRPLKQLADAESTTLFVALLAAYKAFLGRLTGQTDLIVGAPFAGRDHSVTESLIGCFVKTVALRTDFCGDPSFREVVRRVSATTLEAQDNQSVSFERIVAELKIPREMNYSPVFQTLFVLQNTSAGVLSCDGVEVTDVVLDSETSKWDLALSLTETSRGVSGFMEYSSDLFNEDTVARFVEMYETLLFVMVSEPDRPVSAHRLISAKERERILYGLNTYERPEHPYRTMAEPFEEQVARTPDAVALVGDEGTLTYSALNEQANRLAHFLRDSGVGRGSFVAVCMERSFSLIVALYGIAKSGAAYVPLDPELPIARIAFMLEDTAPSFVLVDSAAKEKIPQGSWQVVSMDEEADRWAALPSVNTECEGPTHHLVHLLYTSGSTGRPKAVAYPVDGAITEIFWLHRFYPLQAGDANIFKTSYGFDVSIWEIFWALYFGAKLVICRPGGHRDPGYLVEMIERHGVTTIFLIPSMLEAFLNEMPAGSCRSLRWVICGGAPVTPRLRDTFYAQLDADLIQGYGPTEAGCVTDMIVPPDPGAPTVPLGRPAANYRLYVLDEALEVTPVGVPGEAYIAGEVGIGQCYYARPEMTAEKFLPDPFGSPGGRMYRTGDICRYRNDGVLEHLGRSGRQVKIRGMRVELAEIEAVLCEHETVESCVVLAVEDQVGQRILAFVVPQDERPVDADELAEYAGRFLPRYMVPASIVSVSKIPTTINGKVDGDALLARWRDVGATVVRETVPPSGESEERMKCVFEQVLGCEGVSVTDSFFNLGGHSLLVFKLISMCVQEFSYRPSVADIFSSPSVRELCARMDSSDRRSDGNLVPLVPTPGKPIIVFIHAASGSALPFFEVAKRLSEDFSTFGLQASEVDDDNRDVTSIENLARSYVEAVDAIRGMSPLIIAGWSMGGCVGLEMVRQWRERGVDVAGLLMLDTLLPPKVLASADVRAEARRTILGIDVLGHEGLAPSQPDETSDTIARIERQLDANRLAFLDYEPAWFDGEIDYLRAVEPFPDARKLPDTYSLADRGWGPHVRSVAVHDIAGNHFSLVSKEYAAALADTIRNVIEARLSFSDI